MGRGGDRQVRKMAQDVRGKIRARFTGIPTRLGFDTVRVEDDVARSRVDYAPEPGTSAAGPSPPPAVSNRAYGTVNGATGTICPRISPPGFPSVCTLT